MTGFSVTYFAVTFIAIFRAWGYPNASALDGWMTRHGLVLDSSSRPLIAAYLRRTRWIRTIGFLVGWTVPLVWLWATDSTRRMAELGTNWWAVGFAVGIVVAEVVRPRSDGGRSATLEPRRLSQYLPGFTRIDPWILAGVVALLAFLGAVVPSEDQRLPVEFAEVRNSFAWYVTMCVVGIGIIVGIRVIQEIIVRRRQSFDSVDEAQADDALRSASVQGLAGVGYGGPMWIGAIMAWDLGLSTADTLSGPLHVLAFVLAVAGFGMIVGFPSLNARWIVHRAREA